MSSEPQREYVGEQLSAPEESLRHSDAEGTIVQYEQELCRQRRVLNIIWKPQVQLHAIVLPQHYMTEEENLCNQQKIFRVGQTEWEPPQVKEEQEELEPSKIKEEQEEPEPSQIKEEQEELEPSKIKEEQEEPEPSQIKEEQEEPEPPQIKEEQEELCISKNEEQLDLKQETDTLMETPTYEENEHSEADLNNQPSFNVIYSWDGEGSQHEESASTTFEETDPQNKDQRKKGKRGHVQNVHGSYLSQSPCDTDVRKKPKTITSIEKHKQFTKEKRRMYVKSDKSIKIAHNVSVHKRFKHDERAHICEECGKTFDYWSHFRLHMRSHTGEKPFSCQECGKDFSKKSSLKEHMRTHTRERPYTCKECDASFSHISSLKTHMRTHTGEKPFSCKECDTHFSKISNLKTHMRTHTGEKPFSCKECDKSFSEKSNLKRHMVTHTAEKPFFCQKCDKSFSQMSYLKLHMKTHTREKPFSYLLE